MSEHRSDQSRVCLVTGASRGIGLAIATRLIAAGHRVGLAARSADLLDKAVAELGENALAIPADLTDAIGIDRAYEVLEQAWGPVEVLVANAGSGVAAPLVDTTDEVWQRMLDLNLTAPFRCIRRGLPNMLEAGWGRVVVIASVVAKRGEAEVAAYTASKHGVLGLVRSAAAEVARSGVTVNAICPGYVDSPMTDETVAAIVARTRRKPNEARQLLERRQPIGRLISPDEVAGAVQFCIDNAAVTGQGINVDGGAVQS
ncbi:MAG TPA: SDR family oxidoreductase [Jatrophihabitans sp.]|jgi:NAD(P)-dependent dehydrogenase (short-subunit alcohol dehydrogenase family)